MHIVKLHTTDSTNDYLRRELSLNPLKEWYTVSADEQTHGRGQRGTQWRSFPGMNLTFSTLITDSLAAYSPFEVNKWVSVGLIKWLAGKGVKASIKWPNDILSGNLKLAGILIETSWANSRRKGLIIGIGLNVNQMDFPKDVSATSLVQILGAKSDRSTLLIDFLLFLQMGIPSPEVWIADYESFLYGYHQMNKYQIDGQTILAKFDGVDPSGKIRLLHHDQVHLYDIKEVKWILKP